MRRRYNHMLKTLERYQKCSYEGPETSTQARENQLVQSSRQEYLKLKSKVEALQRSQRNLLGEDLGSLSVKELDYLEKQLDMSLKEIRSTRTQQMLDQLTDLQKKEQVLNEANKSLRQRLMELSPANAETAWANNAIHPSQHPHGNGFFHPLDLQPTLQIGYPSEHAPGPVSMTNFMPGWLGD